MSNQVRANIIIKGEGVVLCIPTWNLETRKKSSPQNLFQSLWQWTSGNDYRLQGILGEQYSRANSTVLEAHFKPD